MNIKILIFGIVFVMGGQSLQAAVMPQLSPSDQRKFERRLAEQRAKAKQRRDVHESIAPRGEDLRELQSAIAQRQSPLLPLRSTPSSSGSTLRSPSSSETGTQSTISPAILANVLRQVGAYTQCAFPISNQSELKLFASALARSQPGKYLFTGNNFADATVANVLRTWGTRFPEGKIISKPVDLHDWALFYQTLATKPDTRSLAPIAEKIDANQPGISFEEALKKVTLRYVDILTDKKNIRDFSAYKKNIVSTLKEKKQVYANKENKGLQDVVANIDAVAKKPQKLIASFIYCIATNQWNKETSSNPHKISGNEFKQMVINSAIAVLFQMKNGVPFAQSMQRIFGEFYLSDGTTSSSPASSSSSPSLIEF